MNPVFSDEFFTALSGKPIHRGGVPTFSDFFFNFSLLAKMTHKI
jgi:hypothetical protein